MVVLILQQVVSETEWVPAEALLCLHVGTSLSGSSLTTLSAAT